METIRIALVSLYANRLRSILTTLGIIIGIGAVIGLISLGRGVEDFIASEFESLGSNLLIVFASPPKSPTRERIEPITTVEATDLLSLPTIQYVAPIHGLIGNINSGGETFNATTYGVTPDYLIVRNYAVRWGRWVTVEDLDSKARVMVLGSTVAEELFGKDYNPVGEIVRYREVPMTIIGVMEKTSEAAGENEIAYIPLTTSQQRLAPPFRARTRDGGYFLDALYLQATSEDAMDEATRQIDEYLREAHNVQFDGEEDYTIVNQADVLEVLGSITGVLTIFLSLIAGISLLVGGIGIMNIMLVTVTERTKEIGLRKAVGAPASAILTQFLVESVVLSIIGGSLGVLLGWFMAIAGTILVDELNLSVDVDAVVFATSISILIGIVFGLYPAWQASRKNPVDSLRFE
jgi:putative ABC transport system permease protein